MSASVKIERSSFSPGALSPDTLPLTLSPPAAVLVRRRGFFYSPPMSMRPRLRRDVLRPLKWSANLMPILFFLLGAIFGWTAAMAYLLWYFGLL